MAVCSFAVFSHSVVLIAYVSAPLLAFKLRGANWALIYCPQRRAPIGSVDKC